MALPDMTLTDSEVETLLGHLEDDFEGYTEEQWLAYDRHAALEMIYKKLRRRAFEAGVVDLKAKN